MVVLGIDIGGAQIKAGMVDEAGAILAARTIETPGALRRPGLCARLGLSCARPSLPVAATKRWWEMNGSEFMLAFHLLGCLHCDRAATVFTGRFSRAGATLLGTGAASPSSGRIFR